jgi:hypothetical protein
MLVSSRFTVPSLELQHAMGKRCCYSFAGLKNYHVHLLDYELIMVNGMCNADSTEVVS